MRLTNKADIIQNHRAMIHIVDMKRNHIQKQIARLVTEYNTYSTHVSELITRLERFEQSEVKNGDDE